MMKNYEHDDQPQVQTSRPSRRARLQALLFSGAALGTTLASIGVLSGPKVPFGGGE